jgi:hypothetical protein
VGVRIAEWREDRLKCGGGARGPPGGLSGPRSFHYRSVSHKLDRVATEGDGFLVFFDYRTGKRAPAPPHVRHAFDMVNSQRHALEPEQRPEGDGGSRA